MAEYLEGNGSFEEMEKNFERLYEREEVAMLGEGTYGKVYKARSTQTGEFVAMKRMKLDSEEEGVPSTAIREVALLKEARHENVVKLLDVFCTTSKLVLVFEFLENDLKKYMKSYGKQPLPPAVVKNLTLQLCRGIEYCHSNRILHRDLKPQNLLIGGGNCLKIADFGLARAYSVPIAKYTHEVVTVWYRAPEILLGKEVYSVPVDIWSVGCVMAEMATSSPMFGGDSEIHTIFKIFQKLGTPSEAEWPDIVSLPDYKPTFPKWRARGWANIRNIKAQVGSDGIDLLENLMAYDPKARISARKAKDHPYFRDAASLLAERHDEQ
jgi:serine/threonine protein kinase